MMRALALGRNDNLRGRRADSLDAWINDAINTNLAPIMRFARMLYRETDAIRNAVGPRRT